MLKVYQRVDSTIKKLHEYVGKMVLEDWSTFDGSEPFDKSRLEEPLLEFYENYKWFENGINRIYELLPGLSSGQRDQIKMTYLNNNNICDLCKGDEQPIMLVDFLPKELADEIKELFEQLYTKMLGATRFKREHDDPKSYYDKFYTTNKNHTCPFCGYHNMKSDLDKGREAYDHYLPKSKYPFAAVNFENLIPMCYECNSSYKGSEDPLLNGSTAFFPFNADGYTIEIKLEHPEEVEWSDLKPEECQVKIETPHQNELATWNRVFEAEGRYLQRITQFDDLWNQYLRICCRRNLPRGTSVKETIEEELQLLEEMDPLYDMGFLKKAYFTEILNDEVYLETLEEMMRVA